jgi:hypothetical protein
MSLNLLKKVCVPRSEFDCVTYSSFGSVLSKAFSHERATLSSSTGWKRATSRRIIKAGEDQIVGVIAQVARNLED